MRPAAALCVGMTPCMIDQDAAHQLCGNSEEVRAVFPVNALAIDQPHICLVDQRCRLQRVTGTLAAHVMAGQLAQLAIDQRHQLVERRFVAVTPLNKQLRDFVRVLGHREPSGIKSRVRNILPPFLMQASVSEPRAVATGSSKELGIPKLTERSGSLSLAVLTKRAPLHPV